MASFNRAVTSIRFVFVSNSTLVLPIGVAFVTIGAHVTSKYYHLLILMDQNYTETDPMSTNDVSLLDM